MRWQRNADPSHSSLQIRSVLKQCEESMGVNRRADRPAALVVAGFSGRVAEIGMGMSAVGWRAKKVEASIQEAYEANKVLIPEPVLT